MLRRKYDVVNRDAAGFISRRTEEDREEEHFPLVSVRFAASSQSRAEELRRRQKTHASRGKEREKKIKNKAHSQHEFHEESDEPKHDETCVKREKKEKKRTVSATPKEGKAPPCVDDDDDDDDDDEWEKEEEEEEEIRELRSAFCGTGAV